MIDPIEFAPEAIDPFDSPYRPGATRTKPSPQSDRAEDPRLDPPPLDIGPIDFETEIRFYEVRLIEAALKEMHGHQGKAADHLGLTYHQFRGLLRKHDMDSRKKRQSETDAPRPSM